jgi:hypothetical protein
MKLVVDNTIELNIYNFQDIAACVRRFADQLEAGDIGQPTRLILVVDRPDGIAVTTLGENATAFEIMGLLEAAKIRAYEANIIGEDD